MDKDFTEEFYRIFNLYKSNDSFLWGKAADGELLAIENQEVNNGEFHNDGSVPQERRDQLLESLQYKNPNFYLGVICPCCCNWDGRSERMKALAGQDFEHLSYANLFVNGNYPLYKEHFLKSYSKYDVHLVCHESSKIENLPFTPEKVYPISRNAWVNNYNLIKQLQDKNLEGKLILLAAGPFGNILGHQLFQSHSNNKILDIGSTLNPFLESEGFRRDYYVASDSGFGARKCIWN
jgi:hypothetical protein